MRAVRLKKQPDYSPGPATKDITRELTKDEWAKISALIEFPDVWTPLNEQEEMAMSGGNDGAKWIFEQQYKKNYVLLDLWCPKDYGPSEYKAMGVDITKVRDFAPYVCLGLHLLKLSELTPEAKDIY